MSEQEGINLTGEPQASQTQQAQPKEALDSNSQSASSNADAQPGEATAHETEVVEKLNRSEKSVKSYQRTVVRLLVVVVVLWLLFFKVVGLTHMPSGDMYPRLDAGDLVLFYRLDTDVSAQDIIVLEKETPDSNGQKQMFISRVVAKEGDVVEIKNDRLYVNGNMIMETNIFYDTPVYEGLVNYPVTLGPGECFVLADKRDEGADSRFFGPVKREEIQGSVITIMRRNNL